MTVVEQQGIIQRGREFLYPNYRQPDLVMSHGSGSILWDLAGKRYIDLYAGIAVSCLGHCHPRWAQAVAEQAKRLVHVSNYYFTEPNVRLAEELCRRTQLARAFFCSSGAEANEALLKLARRHHFGLGQPERRQVLAFNGSFHGRTLGALAATGQAAYREGFGPLEGVVHVPYGDLESVSRALDERFAGILVEPVQGEGGVLPAPPGFLRGLRDLCDRSGALMLADEVQTGVGRTGRFLACEHAGVLPDAVALAKGLGAGFPIGAMLCRREFERSLPPGSHGTTYGGNPLGSAAALAVLETLDAEDLVERASWLGEQLGERLAAIAARHPAVVEGSRGQGLLRALQLRSSVNARALVGSLRDAGVLVTVAGGSALRFSPALNVPEDVLWEGLAIVTRELGSFA